MSRERILIVGASLAGVRAAAALRQHGYPGDVVLLGAEPELPYHRPPLSKDLLGAAPPPLDELWLERPDWYAAQGIELRLGQRAVALDRRARAVELASGERVGFDRLVIATGAGARRLEVPGATRPEVHALRTLADARALAAALPAARSIVIVGAGLIGLEVAAAARRAGATVTVVERAAAPLPRLGGAALGGLVTGLHRAHGVALRLGVAVREIDGAPRGVVVHLSDGERLAADRVVVAIGVAPTTGWLTGSGVVLDDGVRVDEHGETALPGVLAAGDVARTWHPRLGRHLRHESYAAASDHGLAVGRTLAGWPTPFAALPGASSVQHGVRVQVLGLAAPGDQVIVRGDGSDRRGLGLVLRDGAVVAAFAVDRARDFVDARKLVGAGARVDPDRLADPGVPLAAAVRP